MMPKPKILIADDLAPAALAILAERGLDYECRSGLKPKELAAAIGDCDGLIVRSGAKVTAEAIAAGKRLKVIGRAGIGIDNVDLKAATTRGICVMNTPFGNNITTAEHTIAMILALARHIPQADRSTQAGHWEKAKFLGIELAGKTLGLIGCGNIGTIVADRAQGLKMKVIAFDPYLSPERAAALNVEKVDFDSLLARADILSLHTPLTAETRHILDAAALAKSKPGQRIVNCARGELIVEADLRAALDRGGIAGAAIDVFAVEPPSGSPLFGHPHVICTPHLGAATHEAQINVALQIAEQIADFLLHGAVANALNMPAVTLEEAPKLRPYMKLAEQLGAFVGQASEMPIERVIVEYEGQAAALNTRPLTALALQSLLRPTLAESVNMVNALHVARQRNIELSEIKHEREGDYHTLMRITVESGDWRRSIAGTLFADRRARVVEIKGIRIEAEFGAHMLYIANDDRPGLIGRLGTLLGDCGVNIATFALGRSAPGADAIALIATDEPVGAEIMAKIRALPHIRQAKALAF